MSDHNGFSNGNKADEDARKLFVGGLPPSADKAEVESYFSQFGEVEMCTIKTDQFSGRSRGFGFLIYKDVEAVNKVLADPDSHMIQDKKIDPKLATPQAGHGRQEEKSTKVFVGGLDKATSKEELTSIFAQRGNVVDVYLPTDKMTNEPKGFAFVNFDSSEIVETLINEAKITINGKECDLKKATNKSDSSRGGRGGFRGGRGGFRGGRGGYGGGYDQYGGGYDQYNSGYGGGYQGGYQSGYGNYGGGYDQYSSGGGGGYDQSGAAYGGGYGGGYDQQQYGDAGYGAGSDQYKMKSGRGRGGASTYQPY